MWATLALATALSLAPHQTGELKLTHARSTYGVLGPVRADDKLLPGDLYFVRFDIENLKVGSDGTVLYSMGFELLNSKGNKEYAKEPTDLTAKNDLGGTSMPGFAATEIGVDTAPGEYTMKVTVTDRSSKQTATLERKFEVLPKAFGIVRSMLAYATQSPLAAPSLAVPGQSMYLNFAVVGFTRAKDKEGKEGQPSIAIEIVVLDEQGNPTLKKPLTDQVIEAPKNTTGLPIIEVLQFNRTGKFTIKATVEDRVAKKKATMELPLKVVADESK
jgi:hypothetical protein